MGRALEGCHVLVAEDEPLIAMDLAEELRAAGAGIVGPSSTVDGAMELFCREKVDAAVLDIKLGKKLIYPLADMLVAKNVPFIYVTGWGAERIPKKFADVPICEKPFPSNSVTETLKRYTGWRTVAQPGTSASAAPCYHSEFHDKSDVDPSLWSTSYSIVGRRFEYKAS
jgi:two-component SAPR family response regulator